MDLYHLLPPDAVKIVLVLFLSFLIGLEREERKTAAGSYSFGGVRTFPLIGFIGYSIALLSGAQLLPVI
ncbi:MAG TPA: MgtC/SapB family protein, partial [Candidatus Binatus sp.]|nr:MgtC/SapB family protein [Candidatus Binatus sp.]